MIKLRKIKEQDLKLIMEWRMLPEVTRYMYTDPKLTIEEQKLWYDEIKKSQIDLYWIIEYDSIPIGVFSIRSIDKINQRCSWGYYIGASGFKGKGIATVLECNLYDYAFYSLGLNKVCCEVFEFNDKVINIHQKFGAEIEGILKEHIIKNGEKYDVVSMAILKGKWDSIRENYHYEKIAIE
ncbi:MAG TPA: UDP-4-amino-4,6-dideoxy-N-acetyl-beta-L-altrosamine N-acetyltransferase [Bacillota bacterium]|nr:UDP-4-amino-4,6-dideoxy-N-acetyl-beta-L-altrosamine N-acetyltransferase [Bacillota bacterium]